MRKRKKLSTTSKVPLDRGAARKPRGRPRVRQSEIVGRAANYRHMFWSVRLDAKRKEYVRDKPYEWAVALVMAKSKEDVVRALDSSPNHIQSEFKPLVSLMLQVLRERDFPKREENEFDFLADSLAARGQVSPRGSRDICAEARVVERARSAHKIIRHEYYVECSCGYKGPARDNACRKCGAEISLLPEMLWGFGLR